MPRARPLTEGTYSVIQEILSQAENKKGFRLDDIYLELGISPQYVQNILNRLRGKGFVVKEGPRWYVDDFRGLLNYVTTSRVEKTGARRANRLMSEVWWVIKDSITVRTISNSILHGQKEQEDDWADMKEWWLNHLDLAIEGLKRERAFVARRQTPPVNTENGYAELHSKVWPILEETEHDVRKTDDGLRDQAS